MSQVYSTYTGAKPVEQPAPAGDGQQWLSCEVCSLTFKNQQHYSIHCGGTFHANRVAASLRTQQTSTKGSVEGQQGFESSTNPSYWTGMQQAFSFAEAQQHDTQKSTNRSQGGQGQLNSSAAEAYQSQLEYVSYPVGKQTKQPSDSKTTGGYEAQYGMPGFGWSDMQPDSSTKSDYQLQQYPSTARLPELQQTKGSSFSKPAASHDSWQNYQPPQPETGRVQAEKGFGSKKPLDYGYSTQDLSVASYPSQKSDVPSWMKTIEPAVQKPESYRSSNKAALYGSHDPFSNDGSTRGTDDPWKSTPNYDADVRGQTRRTNEESYGKGEQLLRSKTRWDADDYSSSRETKQRSDDPNRQGSEGRRREEDSYAKGSYRNSRESSSSRNNEDSYRKRESGRWEDARGRDSSHRKQESDVKQNDDSLRRGGLSYKEMPYDTTRSKDAREIGGHAAAGKGKEDSGAWDSSCTGAVNFSGYTSQHRDQGFVNRAAGKQDIPQFEQTEWKPESWGAYDSGWQAKAPEAAASSHSRKSLPGAEALNQKTGFDQQRKTSWGGAVIQDNTDADYMQAEASDMWDAAYVSSAASGVIPWSATPAYTSAGYSSKNGRNEKTLGQGRGGKGSWIQKEVEKNSSSQLLQGGNTWPIASSGHGHGSDMQHNSRIAGDQEWHSVDDVLANFKQASKKPGQKPVADSGSSAYGDHLAQGLSSYTTRPSPGAKPGQRTLDPTGTYDWNWTSGAEDNQQEFEESYNEQEFADPTVPYHQGVSNRGGNYSIGRGAFPQPGLRDANSAGQKVVQANQWTNPNPAWPNTEQRGGRGAFATNQQPAGQAMSVGRGLSGFQETKNLGRGLAFGRSEAKGFEKPVGLIRSVQKGDRAEKQDWARPFNHGGQGLLGEAPDAFPGSENAGRFRAQEASGAANADRGGGRGIVGNRPTPQPGEIGGWRQGFQDQGKLNVSAGRGGPMRGSESSLGQMNSSWGFGGAGVKPAASSLTKGFAKGQEGKPSSNLLEKMRQLSEQSLARDCSEKVGDSQASKNSVRTSVAAAGQRANQNNSSVPSLLNLNVAPTGKSQKSDHIADKYSRDAANSKQKSSGVVQSPSSAFGSKKPEQSSAPSKMSGSATTTVPATPSRQELVVPSSSRSVSSNLNRPLSQQAVQPAATSVPVQKALTPKQPLLPTPSMPLQSQNKQTASVDSVTKKPSGPVVKSTGGPGDFDPLDPASARKTGGAGDNKQKVIVVGSASSVVAAQASVTSKQTGISDIALSKGAATNITCSASKLDSKVSPAAAEAKIGLKSSDSQLRGNGPTATCSSSATAITPQPAAQASSTGNTPRLDPSKKPVAQKNIPVGPRDAKKEDQDNDDECDPALSEALGLFFSEGKEVPTETVKPTNLAKKTTSGAKFVPTIRTYAVRSLAGFSKENPSGTKSDSSGDNTKTVEQPKKALPVAITSIKVDSDDSFLSGTGDGQKAEGKAGDPIAKLSKLLPPNLMKGIASGHLSKDLLEKVADLLPADVLKQAVEYLQGSGAVQAAAAETPELQQKVQLPGTSVDAASKARTDEEKSQTGAIVDTTKKAGKPTEAPSRVQVIQPRKGLPNPAALGSTNAKGPAAAVSVKTPLDIAGNNKESGTLASVAKPPVQGSVVPSKRKYDDIDPAKLKNLNVDEMMKLFQELLQDVLGSLFEEDQKLSDIGEKRVLDGLSVEDREIALKVRQMTGITDLSRIIHTMNVLKSLNSETIQALGQLDKSIIASSLRGNERAQKMGVTVLHQITELMTKGAPDSKQTKVGPPVPVGRGRGSVRPPQPGSSSSSSGGRGVQSLLTMNFMEAPKRGALSAGLASATRPLLPTPRFPQQPRFPVDSMMAPRSMGGLLPTPPDQAHMQNFARPFLGKRGPLQPDELYGSAPPIKRWR